MIRLFSICVVSAALIAGCKHQSKPADTAQTHINPKLQLSWSVAKKNEATAKSPALYEYKNNGKALLYLASQHSNRLDSPGFALIKHAIETHKPDVIILEG